MLFNNYPAHNWNCWRDLRVSPPSPLARDYAG